jgi:3-oxoacyl-(acyl-carrier-protein) synthase
VAALIAAREAVATAGWSAAALADAALVVATSRGSAAGWLTPWPGRRPFPVLAASNSMHAEPATAIGIEFGIRGPCHVMATGCAAGLDALGIAALLIGAGAAPRALVAAVDLPLVPPLLDAYARTGLLSRHAVNDPYSPAADGMIPAEAAAAIALDPEPRDGAPRLLGHLANSEACHPTGAPPAGSPLAGLVAAAVRQFGVPAFVCPHASGTAALARAEPAALRSALGRRGSLWLLKPLTGHAIAASGLLETAVLAGFLHAGHVPPSLPGLTLPPDLHWYEGGMPGTPVFKLASGLGGHNAVVALAGPEASDHSMPPT